MMLDVYLDLGNVAGYLALDAVEALAADTGIEVNWLPIDGIVPRPLSPEKPAANDDPLAEFKQLRWQAKHAFETSELERDCQRLQLEFAMAKRTFDASLSHQALLYVNESAQGQGLEFVRWVYAQQFRQGRELVQCDITAELQALGLDASGFVDHVDDWQSEWEAHKARYLELGIHDSPAFVLPLADEQAETFQGRQHFPLLRWRIAGGEGTPPV